MLKYHVTGNSDHTQDRYDVVNGRTEIRWLNFDKEVGILFFIFRPLYSDSRIDVGFQNKVDQW